MNTKESGKKGWAPERLESFEATKMLLSKGAEVVMLNRNEKSVLIISDN